MEGGIEGGTGAWKEKGVMKSDGRGFGRHIIPVCTGKGQERVIKIVTVYGNVKEEGL